MRAGLTRSSIPSTSIFMRVIAIRQRASTDQVEEQNNNSEPELKNKNSAAHSVIQRGERLCRGSWMKESERAMLQNGKRAAGWNRRRERAAKILIIFIFLLPSAARAPTMPQRKIKLLSGSTKCLHIIISLHFISFFAGHSNLFGCSAHSAYCAWLWWCCSVDAAKRFGNNSFASLSFIFDYCFPPFFRPFFFFLNSACTFTRFDAFFPLSLLFPFSGRCTLSHSRERVCTKQMVVSNGKMVGRCPALCLAGGE